MTAPSRGTPHSLAMAAGLFTATSGAFGSGTITGIGVLTGGSSAAVAVSDNGVLTGVALVYVGLQPPATPIYTNHAVMWSLGGGLRDLGPTPLDVSSGGRGISANGAFVAGEVSANGYRAMRWSEGTGMVPLGVLPGFTSTSIAYGISGDGQVVVGQSSGTQGLDIRAFRWESGIMQNLGVLPGDTGSRAEAISRDGTTVVGTSFGTGARAFRWTGSKGMRDLGSLANHVGYQARGVSEDGSVIVGVATRLTGIPITEVSPFRWDGQGMTVLGILPQDWSGDALGVSPDGRIIVGQSRPMDSVPTGRAVIWTSGMGIVDLNVYLPTIGVDLTGWKLQRASAITNSGRFIVGLGEHQYSPGMFRPEGFIVHLAQGIPCYANCDGSSAVPELTANDFMCFIDQFAAGSTYANCDGSTATPVLTANDFTCFIGRYASGCP